METNNQTQFYPSSPIHPYEILVDELKARGLSRKEFAALIGMKPSNFSRMLKAKGNLSSETALRLEEVLGIPYSLWMKLQEEYIKDCIRLKVPQSSEMKDKSHDDIYVKLNSILKPIIERAEGIKAFIHSHHSQSISEVPIEELHSIEADLHQLGKTLCKVKL